MIMGGQRIGRYRVVRKLGAGAFSTVWLGHDDELDAPVAIKVLGDNWADNVDVDRRFVEEATALRRIRDPRVVRVHDIGRTADGRGYFVMDYADTGTVAELVDLQLDLPVALGYAIAAADAVQAVHDHGLLHRDVKPSNLLRHRGRTSGEEYLMVADLGMAKALQNASGLTLVAGTPAYMAPEQARGEPLDARADVYGLAALSYALLTGHPPFPEDRTALQVALRPADSRPASVGRDDLDAVLQAGLAADRRRRPATAAELGERLADCLPTPAPALVPALDPVGGTGGRGRIVALVLACLAVFVAAGLVGWWAWGLLGS